MSLKFIKSKAFRDLRYLIIEHKTNKYKLVAEKFVMI